MASISLNTAKIILVTGEPGIGKSTLIKNVCINLKEAGFTNLNGFITEELRDHKHSRMGFDIIDINNPENRASLARTSDSPVVANKSLPQVGKYSVTLDAFENVGLPIISNIRGESLYVIDEIGKMELLSAKFKSSIRQLIDKIDTENIVLFASVPLQSSSKALEIVENLKKHPKATLYTLNYQNRNSLVNKITELLISSFRK